MQAEMPIRTTCTTPSVDGCVVELAMNSFLRFACLSVAAPRVTRVVCDGGGDLERGAISLKVQRVMCVLGVLKLVVAA